MRGDVMVSISQERSRLDNVAGAPNMRRRWQWKARKSYTDARTVTEPATRVFVHISVTNPSSYNSNDAHARAIESIGISRFPNTGISYNRGIMHNGALYEFQPIGRRGAHTVNDHQRSTCNRWGAACPGNGSSLTAPSWNLNYNARSYVICQNVGDSVTDSMIDSIARQVVADYEAGFITRSAAHNFHGHRCVSSKSCPGDKMWARMHDLHTQIHSYLDNGLEEGGTMAWGNNLDSDGTTGTISPMARDIIPETWGVHDAQLLGYAAAMLAYIRNVTFAKPGEYSVETDQTLTWFIRQAYRHARDASQEASLAFAMAEKNDQTLQAILEATAGTDAEAIKDHIDQRHVEVAQRQAELSTKLDILQTVQEQLVGLIEAFDASEMTAEEVAAALQVLIHEMTAPDAEGN